MPSEAIQLASEVDHAPLAYAQMDAPPLSAPFVMTVTFCDTEQQFDALAFDAQMPAHRHGMNFTVDVSKIADNQFRVSNVVFHMPGLWEFRVEATGAGQKFTYTAEVSLK